MLSINVSIKVSSVGPATVLEKLTLLFIIFQTLWPRLQKDYFGKHFSFATFREICAGKDFDIKSQVTY